MPLTLSEALTDLPSVLNLLTSAEAAVAALPPAASRKAVDYAKAFGFVDGSPGYQLAVLIDTVEAQVKS
jgi:hypothetical protein